jgi:glucose/arabinose dehydrogenase
MRPAMRIATGVLLLASLAACNTAGDGDGPATGGAGGKADDLESCTPSTQLVDLQPAFAGRTFSSPVGLVPAPVAGSRWYLVEKRGVIWTLASESATPTVFADLRARVNAGPQEAGLLGLAFSPDFASDGRVYVSYTAPSASSPANLRSRLSRLVSRDGGLTIDPASEEILLSVDQPFENHNGGHIAFGPDGFLYFGLGDGGSAGDPGNRAQNLSSPLGKLLRIDVSSATGYAIPTDNPFAGGGGLHEIWAYGLRNPWRFSFDSATGALWLGDVGQDRTEEIDVITRGDNYGWRVREGDHCHNPASGCASAGLVAPITEYGHGEGISVTGGFVYRGSDIPALAGQYLFGDFGSGRFWALGDERRLVATTSINVSTFAEAQDGEIYAVDFGGGIFRLVGRPCGGGGAPDAGPAAEPDGGVSGGDLTFRTLYDSVLAPRCAPCHTQRAFGGLGMPSAAAAFEALVGVGAATSACAGSDRVAPGDAAASVLYRKVSGEALCGSPMPPGAPLSAAQIDAVRAWIDAGAAF